MDIHKISRYDRRPDENLSRSKKKDGTTYVERYITVQCVDDGLRLTLGGLYVKRLDSVPESAGLIPDRLERAGIKVRLLLLDREFSVEVIAMLQERGVKFLMPCRNTGNVVAALNEFAHKDRPAVSKNIIENNTDSAAYFMAITKRKKSGNGDKKTDAAGEEKPEKKFIGFATNCPRIKIELYSSRWA